MSEENRRKLVSRLRRIAGQINALEIPLYKEDDIGFVTQLQAAVAAANSSLNYFAQTKVSNRETLTESDREVIRLILKS